MPTIVVDNKLLAKDPVNFDRLNNHAVEELTHLSSLYPEFSRWYESKVYPGLLVGERKLLLRYHGHSLSGIAIVKDTPAEKKLCCLRILPHMQGTGVGLRLFQDSFLALQTEKPLLSVSDEHLPEFQRVFQHFGFEIGNEYPDLYRPRHSEFSFNGLLDHAERLVRCAA